MGTPGLRDANLRIFCCTAKGYVDDFLVNRDIFVVFLMAVPMGQGGYGCVAGFGEQVSGGDRSCSVL